MPQTKIGIDFLLKTNWIHTKIKIHPCAITNLMKKATPGEGVKLRGESGWSVEKEAIKAFSLLDIYLPLPVIGALLCEWGAPICGFEAW